MASNNPGFSSGSWRVSSRPQPTPPPSDPPGAPTIPPAPTKTSPRFEVPTRPSAVPTPTVSDIAEPVRLKPTPQLKAQPRVEQRFKSPESLTAKPSKPMPPARSHDTNVTININLPKLKKPTLPDWPWRRIGKYAAILVAVALLSLALRAGVLAIMQHQREQELKNRLDTIQKEEKTAAYKPLVPASNKQVATTASYDGDRKSYSFNDSIKGMAVIVSQQPLPKGGPVDATVAKIAKTMDATTPLALNGATAYMSTNATTGAQTVIMGKNSLLIFVQSSFRHDGDEWKNYLNSFST